MAFKFLCCIWCLLLLFQHSLCFNLRQHCARRCLYGSGGILCNCNAIHFTGKRSLLDPKHDDMNSDTVASHRHNFLLSILNQPEFVDRDRGIILPIPLDQDDTENAIKVADQSFTEDELADSGRSDTKDSIMDNEDTVVLPENPQFRFRNGDMFKQQLFHKGYSELSEKLAQLVRSIWRDMAAHPTNADTDNQANKVPGIRLDSAINRYDSGENDDLGHSDKSEEKDATKTSDATRVKLQVTSHLVQALKSLTNHLPVLLRQHEANGGHRDPGNVGLDTATLHRILRPNVEQNDLQSENLKAWNRLNKYLTYAIARKEQFSPLQRSKRDGSMTNSQTATEDENETDTNV